jgi:hypothetical protein
MLGQRWVADQMNAIDVIASLFAVPPATTLVIQIDASRLPYYVATGLIEESAATAWFSQQLAEYRRNAEATSRPARGQQRPKPRKTASTEMRPAPNEIRSLQIRLGLAVAKANGKRLGRKPSADGKGPRIKVTVEQEAIVKRLKDEGQGVSAIARTTGLSRPTVYSIIGQAVPA